MLDLDQRCACSSHLPHSMCDEECECWGGVQSMKVAKSGRFVDVTYRVILDV